MLKNKLKIFLKKLHYNIKLGEFNKQTKINFTKFNYIKVIIKVIKFCTKETL